MSLESIVGKLKSIGRSIGSKAKDLALYATVGAAAIGAAASASDAGVMKIETTPVQTTWNADGTTEYEVQVRADSTDISTKKINSAEWDFTVPSGLESYLTFVKSTLPSTANPSTNADDFFYGFTMESSAHNKIDNSIFSGELDDNERVVLAVDGPQNKSGILGSYFFTVNSNAPQGVYNFGLHSVYFYDTDGVSYKSLGGGTTSTCQVSNNQFTITPEPATLAFLTLGALGLLTRRIGRKTSEYYDLDERLNSK